MPPQNTAQRQQWALQLGGVSRLAAPCFYAKRQATIINTQHLQQVSGQIRGSERREKAAAQLGVATRSAVQRGGWQLGRESRLAASCFKKCQTTSNNYLQAANAAGVDRVAAAQRESGGKGRCSAVLCQCCV